MKKGDLIIVWKDFSKTALLTQAKTDVFEDVNKKPVIFAKGVVGYYHTTHVRPVEIHDCVSLEKLTDILPGKEMR